MCGASPSHQAVAIEERRARELGKEGEEELNQADEHRLHTKTEQEQNRELKSEQGWLRFSLGAFMLRSAVFCCVVCCADFVEAILRNERRPVVAVPSVDEDEFREEAELREGVVRGPGGLEALLAHDAHAHIGLLDHAHVIAAVTDRQHYRTQRGEQ